MVADIQKFVTDDKFDIIIFNEVLYYLDNPIESVLKFDTNFNEKGYFIFSFYGGREDLKNEIEKKYELIKNRIILKEDNNSSWAINLFRVK